MSKSSPPFISALAHHAADPFRLLVESVVDYAIYMVDPARLIASWNPGAERIYGYSADEIIGQPFTTVFSPHDLTNGRPDELWQRALAASHHEFECVRVRKDKSQFLAVVTVSALKDHFGNHAGFSVVTRDITERKRAEEIIRRERDLSDAILSSLPGIYYMYNEDRRFLRWNARFEVVSGYSADEIRGLHPLDLFDPVERQRVGECIECVFEDGRCEVEADFVTKDGRHVPYFFNGVLTVIDGQRCLLGMGIDITSQKEAREKLEHNRALLRVASRIGRMGAWSVELDGLKVIWSEELLAILELPLDHSPDFEYGVNIYLPEYRQRVRDAFAECVRSGTPFDVEVQCRTASGRCLWVRILGEAVRSGKGTIVGASGAFQDITDRKQSEEILILRDRAIHAVSQGILITDPSQADNPVVFASSGFERMTGYRSDEVIGKNCRFLQGKGTDGETVRELRSAIAAARSCAVEIMNYRKDGKPFWNQLTITPVLGPEGQITHFVGVQTDITGRRRLEEQYRQAQKMEAVGRLAGGVAHDFNNLLTIISGYSELLLAMPEVDADVRSSIKEIGEAGERAASLTRQLLGFSRQSLLQPKVLDLNSVVSQTTNMLRRLIGEDILFTTVLDPKLNRVKVDPGQLDQVLMNLAVNARDAMPKGGKLTVETSNVLLGDDYAASHLDCKSGPHVMVAMSDTGCGMTPEVMARIFEPFYTTKEVGRGSGLGLAMVFGIVQQSGGCIHVYSEPDRGTTFKIYLPAVSEQLSVNRDPGSQVGLRGTETILLVEDEEGVRGLASMSLKMHGYHVLTATDGKDALRVLKSHRGPLDLILTDVVMPAVSGPELVLQLKAGYPGVKVLFMSGYTDDAVVRHGLIEADVAFIQKPYTPLGLARKVRHVLDEKSSRGGSLHPDAEPNAVADGGA